MARKASGNPTGRPKAFCEKEALFAAMNVFAKKGYEATSLTDLEKAMKINRFSIYSTYGNKEALYVKAMEAFNDARQERVASLLDGETGRESVERMLRDVALRFTDAQHGVCFVTQGPLTSEEASIETRRLMARRRAEVEQAIEKRIEDAIKQGELPADTSAADYARYFAVIIQGMALQSQHGGKLEELNRVVDVAMTKWPEKRR